MAAVKRGWGVRLDPKVMALARAAATADGMALQPFVEDCIMRRAKTIRRREGTLPRVDRMRIGRPPKKKDTTEPGEDRAPTRKRKRKAKRERTESERARDATDT